MKFRDLLFFLLLIFILAMIVLELKPQLQNLAQRLENDKNDSEFKLAAVIMINNELHENNAKVIAENNMLKEHIIERNEHDQLLLEQQNRTRIGFKPNSQE